MGFKNSIFQTTEEPMSSLKKKTILIYYSDQKDFEAKKDLKKAL